jgi:hypothetical protein
VGAGRFTAATAPGFVLLDRLAPLHRSPRPTVGATCPSPDELCEVDLCRIASRVKGKIHRQNKMLLGQRGHFLQGPRPRASDVSTALGP